MTQNIGIVDRAVRIVIGIGMLLGAVLVQDPMGWYDLAGFIPLLTGMFGNCPLYSLLAINTCPMPKTKM